MNYVQKASKPLALAACLSLAITTQGRAATVWQVSYCVRQAEKTSGDSDPITVQAKQIINKIAKTIGLSADDITVIACDQADKALSGVSDGSEVKAGKYIMYSPVWLREVIGKDQVQMTALFGHELGHFLRDHFGTRADIPRAQQEAEADHFAGCAIARLDYAWCPLYDLLTRIRTDPGRSSLYPDRLTSIEAAKEGYKDCGGKLDGQPPPDPLDTYVTRQSNWRGGGGNQPGWCAEMSANLHSEFPNASRLDYITSGETTRDTCAPFRCIKYQYSCTVHVLNSQTSAKVNPKSCH